jgi:hypothetical protein
MAEQQDIALQTFNDLGMTASDKVFKHPESSFENLDFTPQDVFTPSSIGASNVTDGSTLLPSVHEEGSGLLNEKNTQKGPKNPKKLPETHTQLKTSSKPQRNYQVFPGSRVLCFCICYAAIDCTMCAICSIYVCVCDIVVLSYLFCS